jgi:hypothetical protein
MQNVKPAYAKLKDHPNRVAIWVSPAEARDPKISQRRYLVNRNASILQVTQQARKFIPAARNLVWFVYEHINPPLDLNAKAGDVYDQFCNPVNGFLVLMYHELDPS